MTVPVRLSGWGRTGSWSTRGQPHRHFGASSPAASNMSLARLPMCTASPACRVTTATVPSLQVTRKEVRNIHAPLLNETYMGADGILGTDSLRSQRVLFDFEATHCRSCVGRARFPLRAGDHRGPGHSSQRPPHRDRGDSERPVGNRSHRHRIPGHDRERGAAQGPDARGCCRAEPIEIKSVTGEKVHGDYMFVRELQVGESG